MALFIPELVYFEPAALDYAKGRRIHAWALEQRIPLRMTSSHNRITGLAGENEIETYRLAKRTLVVGVRKTLTFEPSLPSAEYALPLATGCIAHCHYCYLQTTMGAKPYVRIYVNTDEVFAAASRYIAARAPEVTRFEAACTSDPLSLEHISGSLAEAIQFFARQPLGRLRFVSKFAHVEPLLGLHHGGHTRIRFSINCDYVIKHFEGGTAPLQARIEAAAKVAKAGYPLGFIVAPIIWHDGWAEGYRQMVRRLVDALQAACGDWPADVTFELIQHRFTKRAKAVITSRYPHSALEMNEAERKYKWGRYGHGKYVYRDEQAKQLEESLRAAISAAMPAARVEYFT